MFKKAPAICTGAFLFAAGGLTRFHTAARARAVGIFVLMVASLAQFWISHIFEILLIMAVSFWNLFDHLYRRKLMYKMSHFGYYEHSEKIRDISEAIIAEGVMKLGP